MKSTPSASHKYTSTIECKLFNFKQTLQCQDIEQLQQNPPKCPCSYLSNYSPAGHIITGCTYSREWGLKVPDIEKSQIPRTSLI
jgi:hypothetical protein